jgi:hypothetical protein
VRDATVWHWSPIKYYVTSEFRPSMVNGVLGMCAAVHILYERKYIVRLYKLHTCHAQDAHLTDLHIHKDTQLRHLTG